MTQSFEPEWRSKPLTERLAYAYTKNLFTDIDIIVQFDSEEHRFKAHRNILSHFSPNLEKKFYGKKTKVINLEHLDVEGFSYFLQQLYHVPSSCHKDRSIILSAYHAAKQLGMLRIQTKLRKEILTNLLTSSLITSDDFWKLLELSRILKLADINHQLLTFAERNAEEVLKAKSLLKASANTVKQVIDLDTLYAPEADVLHCVARWKEGNGGLPFLDDFTKDLLGCVRFQNLSSMEFCQFIAQKHDIISPNDVLKILMHIGNPTTCPLPSWCSSKKFRFRISSDSKDSMQAEKAESHKDSSTVEDTPMNLLEIFTEQRHADVCFMIGQERIPLKAHRNILAIGSVVFEKMFFGPQSDTRYDIAISTQFPEGFKTMIRYFYCDSDLNELFLENTNLAIETFDAALKYGSNILKNTCLEYMNPKNMQLRTFWKELELKSKQTPSKDDKSVKELLHYALKNTKEILECSDFPNATLGAVLWLLNLSFRNVKEIYVLDKVAEWIEHNQKLHESDDTKYKLLSRIRFDDIAPQEFSSFIAKYEDLFSKDESLVILMHLLNKSFPLPSWCYRGSSRYQASTSWQNVQGPKVLTPSS